jgi:L-malate glycosyltransferase
MQEAKKLSIFIAHPSDLPTDCQPHGDGLVAYGFIKSLAKRGHTLHVVVNSIDLQEALPENINLYPTRLNLRLPLIGRLLQAFEIRKIFFKISNKERIDIIHQLNPVIMGLSLSLVGTQTPVVLGPHVGFWPWNALPKPQFPVIRALNRLFRYVIGGLLSYLQQRHASALLIATPFAANRLRSSSQKTQAKTYDLRHGIDAQRFAPNLNLADSAYTPSILFMGSLSYHKGIVTLLDAFEILVDVLPDCQLIIAGPWGDYGDEVKARIEGMIGQSQIKLLGSIQRADVPQLINNCTIYCMPSYGEAFGMGTLEAMACGKPVVGTDAGGLQYLISDQGGRKVPPKDSQALATALLEILSSAELQREMGQHNRNVVEKVYDWDQVTQQLESIYYELIEQKSDD